MENDQKVKTLDKLIFAFLLLFVITLNNSIFFSQIGFFSVYILIGIKSYLLKQNPFKKSELNFAILLLISVFIVSAFFSSYKEEALIRSIKKILLIPIFYSLIYFIDEKEKGKKLFKYYLIAAVATSFVYLFFSGYYYIYHLYSLENKGPSPFQYVMTAGGLMSFLSVFLFSFVLENRFDKKIKFFLIIAFLISLIALVSSYTRAAWVGAIAGFITVLIFRKKWYLILFLVVIVISIVFISKNESKVKFYKISNDKITLTKEISTNGRASDFIKLNKDSLLLADYENGIQLISDEKIKKVININEPVTDIKKWNDSLFVIYTLDQKFYLIKKVKSDFMLLNSFITKGRPSFFKVINNKFYVSDLDSGLTIFTNPKELNEKTEIKYKGINNFEIIDSLIIIFNAEKKSILLKKLNKHFESLDSAFVKSDLGNIFRINERIFAQLNNKLIQINIVNNKIVIENTFDINGIIKSVAVNNSIYMITSYGLLYKAEKKSNNIYSFTKLYEFKIPVKNVSMNDSTLIICYYTRNRLASIYDKYHITNYERLNIWKTGMKIFKDYPILGIGDIDLQKVYKNYKEKNLKENFGHLHNNIINWLVVYGIVGTLIIIYFILKILLFLYNTIILSYDDNVIYSFSVGSFAVIIDFIFAGIGEYNFGDQEIMTLIWFVLGINYAFYSIITKGKSNE